MFFIFPFRRIIFILVCCIHCFFCPVALATLCQDVRFSFGFAFYTPSFSVVQGSVLSVVSRFFCISQLHSATSFASSESEKVKKDENNTPNTSIPTWQYNIPPIPSAFSEISRDFGQTTIDPTTRSYQRSDKINDKMSPDTTAAQLKKDESVSIRYNGVGLIRSYIQIQTEKELEEFLSDALSNRANDKKIPVKIVKLYFKTVEDDMTFGLTPAKSADGSQIYSTAIWTKLPVAHTPVFFSDGTVELIEVLPLDFGFVDSQHGYHVSDFDMESITIAVGTLNFKDMQYLFGVQPGIISSDIWQLRRKRWEIICDKNTALCYIRNVMTKKYISFSQHRNTVNINTDHLESAQGFVFSQDPPNRDNSRVDLLSLFMRVRLEDKDSGKLLSDIDNDVVENKKDSNSDQK